MTLTSRIIANLLLPLLFFCGSYLLFYRLGSGQLEPLPLQIVTTLLSLLVGTLPLIIFATHIRSQLKPGFALLKNGDIVTRGEITLGMILGNQVTAWKLYRQHLDTEVCLQGNGELVYMKMGLDFEVAPNIRGKQFIKHYKHNICVFEAWVQRAIYLASLKDRELLQLLPKKVLLNEEDERVLRSKFLSALEDQPMESIKLPIDTDAITINRETRSHPISDYSLKQRGEELDEKALKLDQELIRQLGLKQHG